MRILDRYIAATIAAHTAIVVFVLLALFCFFAFMDELSDVGKGNYGLAQAGQYVVLSIPRLLYQVFPIAALIGSIAGLGLLARNNELTVMRSAGVSVRQISVAVMKIGLVMVALVTIIGERFAPAAEHRAQVLRMVSMSESISLKGHSGLWARDGSSFVNVREILPDGRLSDIRVYDFADAATLKLMMHAEGAVYRNKQWVLSGVTRHRISAEKFETVQDETLVWDTQLSPELLNVVVVKPDTLSAAGLHRYVSYLQENGLNSDRYEVAYWSKLAAPFITGVMVFLAVPFSFGPLRSVTAGQRLVVGTLLGAGFYLLTQLSTYTTLVFELNPVAGALLPGIVCAAIAVQFSRRVF
jgi:lipopolysaccharide export system permease protein